MERYNVYRFVTNHGVDYRIGGRPTDKYPDAGRRAGSVCIGQIIAANRTAATAKLLGTLGAAANTLLDKEGM